MDPFKDWYKKFEYKASYSHVPGYSRVVVGCSRDDPAPRRFGAMMNCVSHMLLNGKHEIIADKRVVLLSHLKESERVMELGVRVICDPTHPDFDPDLAARFRSVITEMRGSEAFRLEDTPAWSDGCMSFDESIKYYDVEGDEYKWAQYPR